MNDTLEPTHSCFDDAIEFMDYAIRKNGLENIDNDGFKLVHGICEKDGREFSHAWVEWDAGENYVIFCGIVNGEKIYVGTRREDYYTQFGVKERTRYNGTEMLQMNLKHFHYGPWEKKYKLLCGKEGQNEIVARGGDLACFRIGPLPGKEHEQKSDSSAGA